MGSEGWEVKESEQWEVSGESERRVISRHQIRVEWWDLVHMGSGGCDGSRRRCTRSEGGVVAQQPLQPRPAQQHPTKNFRIVTAHRLPY